MKEVSTWTEELEMDLCAYFDDIEAGMSKNEASIEAIDNSARIFMSLPQFVQGWTVKELVAAIIDR